ncbi:3-deoxy-D-manno-octulosonic acid transferase [Desulfogranum japonicum]|uniref:3-deoxy-D-manno-octulosonic acid transferase n=1 Tax=Desulfogranum japonicum TaxID=231447 RepID=UPI000424EC2A|nr:3-deoxy-D-manno-octulosonic acid transferase [Desulfogranum japonicum]
MYLLYNFLQLLLSPILLPGILLVSLSKKKYRSRIKQRLGLDLSQLHISKEKQCIHPVFWVHALSVGETTSALPLIKQTRKQFPEAVIIFTSTTRSGGQLAQRIMRPYADVILASPLDIFFTIRHFINTLQPDLFILIETDFWPNWLLTLKHKHIPVVLVNGRISAKSAKNYHRFRCFFTPLFSCFSLLCMQTEQDAKSMISLGIPPERIRTLGNLKVDIAIPKVQAHQSLPQSLLQKFFLPENKLIWICGSTHPGEEEPILAAYEHIHEQLPTTLIIAPRDTERADAVKGLCQKRGLTSLKRTELSRKKLFDVLLLDTIGELADLYRAADLVFIGGSLVPCGGHNPLEAAVHGKAILFGQHMDDFSEIAHSLTKSNAALQLTSSSDLMTCVHRLLDDKDTRTLMGEHAQKWVISHRGAVERLMVEITALLPSQN